MSGRENQDIFSFLYTLVGFSGSICINFKNQLTLTLVKNHTKGVIAIDTGKCILKKKNLSPKTMLTCEK